MCSRAEQYERQRSGAQQAAFERASAAASAASAAAHLPFGGRQADQEWQADQDVQANAQWSSHQLHVHQFYFLLDLVSL